MSSNDIYNVGDTVLFGRPNGEHTLAKVAAKTSSGRYKLTTLVARGKRSKAGTTWTVPADFIWRADAGHLTGQVARTKMLVKMNDVQQRLAHAYLEFRDQPSLLSSYNKLVTEVTKLGDLMDDEVFENDY